MSNYQRDLKIFSRKRKVTNSLKLLKNIWMSRKPKTLKIKDRKENRENIKIRVKDINKIKMNKVHTEEKIKDKWEGAKENSEANKDNSGANKGKWEDNRGKDLQREDKITESKEVSEKKTIWEMIETTDNKSDLIIGTNLETSETITIMKLKGISPEEMIETVNNLQDMRIKEITNKITDKEITVKKSNQTQE